MTACSELQARLASIATRSADIGPLCQNEESTKQFLVLPVIGALGYDYTNPFVVRPEFAADFHDASRDRVDYVIMIDGNPVIAVECKKVGTDLSACRGQLRGYFTALRSVRLGILTDGLRFEFFVDCDAPNVMDEEPFVTLDLEAAARAPVPDDVVDALSLLTQSSFRPESLAEAAEMRLVTKRLRAALMEEIREPSEKFCRFLLRRVGVKHVRSASIQTRYGSLIRATFQDALVIPVTECLRASGVQSTDSGLPIGEDAQRILTTDRELAVYRYVCRRLAFLASDEYQFSAVEQVHHKDYIGKFSVYYDRVQKGRLFDFIEGSNGYDKFIFPEPFGEVVTNSMSDIDEPLRQTFVRRLREVGRPSAPEARVLQLA